MILELFPCSGGMAEGFRRASIPPDIAFDVDEDACASYEANHGHRPIRMDVRDLLRMVRRGWCPGRSFTWSNGEEIKHGPDLIVADPPCTPWSRAGKRKGVDDERDMLLPTIEIIRLLRPRAYLIGNVPGLDDAPNWGTLQRALAPLAEAGYCIRDFAALDAADFGVPQHRVRPFWFGHLAGPCIRWPSRTHGDPKELAVAGEVIQGIAAKLKPWVTCRDALAHLPLEALGRPVRMRGGRIRDNGTEHEYWSTPDEPAKVITTHDTSRTGITLATATDAKPPRAARRTPRTPQSARQQTLEEPARTIRGGRSWGAGQFDLTGNDKHPVNQLDAPSYTVTAKGDGRGAQGACVLELSGAPKQKRPPSTQGEQWSRVHPADAPAPTVLTDIDRATGNGVKLEWPWPRPATTVQADDRLAPPGHHPEAGSIMTTPNAIVLSERAAAILQGFPESWTFAGDTKTSRWSQIGQAMPPGLAHAVARAVKAQMETT